MIKLTENISIDEDTFYDASECMATIFLALAHLELECPEGTSKEEINESMLIFAGQLIRSGVARSIELAGEQYTDELDQKIRNQISEMFGKFNIVV